MKENEGETNKKLLKMFSAKKLAIQKKFHALI